MPRLSLATGLLALSTLLLAGPTIAQSAGPAAPQPPGASAFEGYRRFDAQDVAPWRESNDTVGRIGGWKVYAREAQQSGPAPAPQATPPGAAAPAQRSDASAVTPPAAARGGHTH